MAVLLLQQIQLSGTGLSGTANTSVTITKGSTEARSYTANWSANTVTYSVLSSNYVSETTGGSVAYVYKDGTYIGSSGRGHTLYTIDINTNNISCVGGYDTYGNGTCSGLVSALNNIGSDKFIVIITRDAITNDSNLVNALLSFGGTTGIPTCYMVRYTFTFVGRRGMSQGSAKMSWNWGNSEYSLTSGFTFKIKTGYNTFQ